jgi:hypothetical protein
MLTIFMLEIKYVTENLIGKLSSVMMSVNIQSSSLAVYVVYFSFFPITISPRHI